MTKLFTETSKDILESFQNSYYSQIGSRMQIGSEEYVLSSIFTYVLMVYAAILNKAYNNQFLDTAEGIYLDNIASKYNLSRQREVIRKPFFDGTFYFKDINRQYNKGEFILNISGHRYTNVNSFSTSYTVNRFVCDEYHSNKLTKNELLEQLKPYLVEDQPGQTTYLPSGIQSCNETITNDDEFRAYIKENKYRFNPGIAGAFESAVNLYADYIYGCHVVRQQEQGYVPGFVAVYCKVFNEDATYFNNFSVNDIKQIVNDDLHILTIGQQFAIARAVEKVASGIRAELFVDKGYSVSERDTLKQLKYAAVRYYFNHYKLKPGEEFVPSEFMNMLINPLNDISRNPDDFGITAEDYDTVNNFIIRGYNFKNSSGNVVTCNPNEYILIDENSIVLE